MAVAFAIIAASGKTADLAGAFSRDDFVVAAFNYGSMNLSNKAMSLVSYPFVVLSKSAKIIPVILVGTLRGVYAPTRQQFATAFLITFGLLLFNAHKLQKKAGDDNSDAMGLLLVLGSLGFDGLT